MNDILREHLDIIRMGILDDVTIYSKHVQHVRTILHILRDNELYSKMRIVNSMALR